MPSREDLDSWRAWCTSPEPSQHLKPVMNAWIRISGFNLDNFRGDLIYYPPHASHFLPEHFQGYLESHVGPATANLAIAAGDTYIVVGLTLPGGLMQEMDVSEVSDIGGGLTLMKIGSGGDIHYLYAWNGLRFKPE
jgi:hypothetical protein